MKTIQKEKGITLIALVITIIILLILAGVSIAMLTGQNRNIRESKLCKNARYTGRRKRTNKISIYECKIRKIRKSRFICSNSRRISSRI